MAGRPRRDPTPEQAQEILRRRKRGESVRRLVAHGRRLGISSGGVRRLLGAEATRHGPLSEHEHNRLREWTGNESLRALARSMGRTERDLRREYAAMGIVPEELITHLGVAAIARLTGLSGPAIIAAIRRGDLRADQRHGSWKAEPADVRAWMLERLSSLDVRVGSDEPGEAKTRGVELMGLLGGLWGISEQEKKRRARARKRQEGGALGPSGRGSG